MLNFFNWLVSEKKTDPFFPEEKQMIEYVKEFAGIKEDWKEKVNGIHKRILG